MVTNLLYNEAVLVTVCFLYITSGKALTFMGKCATMRVGVGF